MKIPLKPVPPPAATLTEHSTVGVQVRLEDGQTFTQPAGAVYRLDQGNAVMTAPAATYRLSGPATIKVRAGGFDLKEGTAAVEARAGDKRITGVTPHGTILTTSARFECRVSAKETLIKVQEGTLTVRVPGKPDQTLTAGQSLVLGRPAASAPLTRTGGGLYTPNLDGE